MANRDLSCSAWHSQALDGKMIHLIAWTSQDWGCLLILELEINTENIEYMVGWG